MEDDIQVANNEAENENLEVTDDDVDVKNDANDSQNEDTLRDAEEVQQETKEEEVKGEEESEVSAEEVKDEKEEEGEKQNEEKEEEVKKDEEEQNVEVQNEAEEEKRSEDNNAQEGEKGEVEVKEGEKEEEEGERGIEEEEENKKIEEERKKKEEEEEEQRRREEREQKKQFYREQIEKLPAEINNLTSVIDELKSKNADVALQLGEQIAKFELEKKTETQVYDQIRTQCDAAKKEVSNIRNIIVTIDFKQKEKDTSFNRDRQNLGFDIENLRKKITTQEKTLAVPLDDRHPELIIPEDRSPQIIIPKYRPSYLYLFLGALTALPLSVVFGFWYFNDNRNAGQQRSRGAHRGRKSPRSRRY